MKELYNQYAKSVFNLALHYLQNVEDAEEVTQDVFVKVYQNLAHFKEQSTLKTWIYRITINCSLDYIKSKKAKKRFGLLTSLFIAGSGEPIGQVREFNHPGVILENKEAVEQLFQLINELPERQKTAIILAKIDQRSQKEIAEIMNMTGKAVESLLVRAKNTLAQRMSKNKEGF